MVAVFIVFNMIYVLLQGLIKRRRHRCSRKRSKKREKKFFIKLKYQINFLES